MTRRRKYRTADEFRRWWASGAPLEEIREALGYCSVRSVYLRASALKLERRGRDNPQYRKMLQHADDIVYAYEAGFPLRLIAEELGVSRTYPLKVYRDVTK